jgi:Resolvase, N terminal domain
MKRVAIYTRISSMDQNTATQLCDLRPLAAARGFQIVGEYTDTISGAKSKRPGLDMLMSDARRGIEAIELQAAGAQDLKTSVTASGFVLDPERAPR